MSTPQPVLLNSLLKQQLQLSSPQQQQQQQQHSYRSLISFLHQFPHLNTSLNRVNSTFDSKSESYLESLGILASLPALLLITSLSLLLFYLVTRCCDGNGKRSAGVGCCIKFVLVLVAVACCTTSSLGLYGNDDLHNALHTVINSIKFIDSYIKHLSVATQQIEIVLGSSIPMNISQVANVFEKPLLNRTAYTELQVSLDYLRRNVSWTRTNVELFNDKYFNLIDSNLYFKLFEQIRWPVTVALQSVFVILNLLLLYAVGRGSRCSFITFSVLGLLALIINWSLVSVYLVLTIATADVCVAPGRIASNEIPGLTGVSRELLTYYIQCGGDGSAIGGSTIGGGGSPLVGEIGFIAGCVEQTRVVLKELKDDAVKFYDVEKVAPPVESIMDHLHSIDMTLQDLESADCQQPHNEYKRAIETGCSTGLVGLTLLLIASATTALLFTIGVGFDSHAWIYLKRKGGSVYKNGGGGGGGTLVKGKPPRNGNYEQDYQPPIPSHHGYQPPYQQQQQQQQQYYTQPRNPSQGATSGRGYYQYATSGRPHHHSQHQVDSHRPNNGQYATLSRACKTLEANDFY